MSNEVSGETFFSGECVAKTGALLAGKSARPPKPTKKVFIVANNRNLDPAEACSMQSYRGSPRIFVFAVRAFSVS